MMNTKLYILFNIFKTKKYFEFVSADPTPFLTMCQGISLDQ